MLVICLIVSIILVIILLVLLILCYIKYRKLFKRYNLVKSDWLYIKNKCSLIEYKFRTYIEGRCKPVSALRSIGEIIFAGFIPPHNGDD